jgi:hypothetical protein
MVLGLVVRNVARVGQQRAVQHVRARGHARLPLLAAARERGTAAAERTMSRRHCKTIPSILPTILLEIIPIKIL